MLVLAMQFSKSVWAAEMRPEQHTIPTEVGIMGCSFKAEQRT
jgi:hypothetical protein